MIYGGDERAERLAEAINEELERTGFANLGIEERTGLAVLRRTEMPAVLIEAGFINHDRDNEIFDNNFNEVASAIAMGIERAVPLEKNLTNQSRRTEETDDVPEIETEAEDSSSQRDVIDRTEVVYGVETGRFSYRPTANFLAQQLTDQGFYSYVVKDDDMLRVIVGKENSLDNALKLQDELRNLGYVTMVVSAS